MFIIRVLRCLKQNQNKSRIAFFLSDKSSAKISDLWLNDCYSVLDKCTSLIFYDPKPGVSYTTYMYNLHTNTNIILGYLTILLCV